MSAAPAKPGDYARFAHNPAQDDTRFASGTPAPKNADLDFIRMTGMTRPAVLRRGGATPAPPPTHAAPWQGESQAALGFREIIQSLQPNK